ncbi:hypothetical protein [Cellulomonas massiliensis]|uniref:hypothetical protein n=1 Tax=Cellulomonas massiliensis TaxID=1465811 RepID=UPI000317FA14|nr:hypothetical protein [Cellulomonas massiliensis]
MTELAGLDHAAAGGAAVAAGVLAALSWAATVVAFGRLARSRRLRWRWVALGAVPVVNLGLLLVLLADHRLAPPAAGQGPTPPGAFATYAR